MATSTPRPDTPRVVSTRDGENEPRLPHEHDESADSQPSDAANEPSREVGERAYQDVRAGRVDTDRGPVMDRLYRRNLRRNPKERGPR